jgi:uncharacterized membrane protein YfcA
MTTPTVGLIWLIAAVAAAGAVTGILAGLFGIGGGAVIVPVLFEFFRVLGVPEEVRMQLCIGTSLAIIVPTTVRSYWAHRKRGLVMVEVMRGWAVPSIIGVAAGAAAAGTAPPGVFEAGFVLIASIIAAKLLLGRSDWAIAETLPGQAIMSGYGFLVGLASSLMGISGGSLTNLILTLYRKPIHNVVATSAGVGVPITIAGTAGYCLAGLPYRAQLPPFSVGFVSIIGVAIIAPISTYIAPLGARLAHVMSRRQLEIGLGLFLLVAAARFAVILVQSIF